MYAKAPIFSLAIIIALYGMLRIFTMQTIVENWKTQNAASIFVAGICNLFCKNQRPTHSNMIAVMIDNKTTIFTQLQKMRFV